MKLHNVIVVFDVYAVSSDGEDSATKARECVLAAIASGELAPSDQNAIQVLNERNIREAWKAERPFVGADVSDADFEQLKGKTTEDVFNMLNAAKATDPLKKPQK
jgi:hypothetical protein